MMRLCICWCWKICELRRINRCIVLWPWMVLHWYLQFVLQSTKRLASCHKRILSVYWTVSISISTGNKRWKKSDSSCYPLCAEKDDLRERFRTWALPRATTMKITLNHARFLCVKFSCTCQAIEDVNTNPNPDSRRDRRSKDAGEQTCGLCSALETREMQTHCEQFFNEGLNGNWSWSLREAENERIRRPAGADIDSIRSAHHHRKSMSISIDYGSN